MTYYEVYLRKTCHRYLLGRSVFLKACNCSPPLGCSRTGEAVKDRPNIGLLDLSIIVLWFVYLYFFFVRHGSSFTRCSEYGINFARLQFFENMIFVGLLGTLWLQSSGGWRVLYRSFFGRRPSTCSPHRASMWRSRMTLLHRQLTTIFP